MNILYIPDCSDLVIEIGELAENYQWKSNFEVFDETKKQEVGYEFVDILIYLIRLAEKSGIDIEKYFDEKLPKLERKFPLGSDNLKQRASYRATGRNRTYD